MRTPKVITEFTVITQRLGAQLLAGPAAPSGAAVVDRLLAVQAQELDGARLAIRARTRGRTSGRNPGPSARDIDHELTETRSLIVSWLNRGTLHLVAAADYWWLQPLLARAAIDANERQLGRLGVVPSQVERGVGVITTVLTAQGLATREQLREQLLLAGIAVAGPIGYLLLARSALLGHTVRGPLVDGEQAYVLVRDWLGRPPPRLDRDVALAELARRYLAGHGPATPADLAKWAGIGRREARDGMSALGSSIAVSPGGLVTLTRGPAGSASTSRGQPRLLGPFDPVLFGWLDRAPLLGPHVDSIVTRNGLFRPAVLARNRIIGSWRRRGSEVVLGPMEALTPAESAALGRDADDVRRFFD